jgi:hypothetical protein
MSKPFYAGLFDFCNSFLGAFLYRTLSKDGVHCRVQLCPEALAFFLPDALVVVLVPACPLFMQQARDHPA